MTKAKIFFSTLLLASLGGLTLVAAGPTAAMPGWSNFDQASSSVSPSVKEEQRDQIEALHSAYRAALSQLDWSIGENGHAPDTMRQAQELRMALRAEIFDVLHRDSDAVGSSPEKGCPYSGEVTPVRFGRDADTLHL